MSDNGETHYADEETLAYISKIEAENKVLQEKLETAEATSRAVQSADANTIYQHLTTIEALNLRVARLVDWFSKDNNCCCNTCSHCAYKARTILSATSQDDQAWLREHDAKVLDESARKLPNYANEVLFHRVYVQQAIDALHHMASELRSQQSKGGK